MKKILITSDFSENSIDAAKIGIEIAKLFKAKVTLLHVYSLPIQSTEFPEMIDFSFYEKIKEEQLKKLSATLNYPEIETLSIASFSFSEAVKKLSENKNFDLIIMGLTGSSQISEIFLGSNTMSLIVHSTTPILAFPKSFKFKSKLKFAFAYDLKKIENKQNMDLLLDLAKKLNSKIHAFHVSGEDKSQEAYHQLKELIPAENFTMETELYDNIDNGILNYITNNEIEILAVIPRKHNFLDRIFHESHTKEIANYCKIPLLILPE